MPIPAQLFDHSGQRHPRRSIILWAIALFLFLVMLFPVAALTITFDPAADVRVEGNTVHLTWLADEDAPGEVRYGVGAAGAVLDRVIPSVRHADSESPGLYQHEATLSSLLFDTEYSYTIAVVSATEEAAEGPFTVRTGFPGVPGAPDDTSGVGADGTGEDGTGEESPDGTDGGDGEDGTSLTPFIVNIPAYHNEEALSISGNATPGTTIRVYVNPDESDEIGGRGYEGITTASTDGTFIVEVSLPEENNTVIIHEEHPDGSEAVHEYSVVVDTEAPDVGFSLPTQANTTSLTIQGTVNEPVTIFVTIDASTFGGSGEPLVQTYVVEAGPFSVELHLQDMQATPVTIEFVDRASNSVRVSQTISVRASGPVIYWHNLGDLSPSYVQSITVRGNATPGSTIIVVVNGKTRGMAQWSTSFIDIVTNAARVVDVATTEDEPAFAAVAGPDGFFEIDVLLTKDIRQGSLARPRGGLGPEPYADTAGLGSGIERIPPPSNASTFVEAIAVDSFDNQLKLLAVDDFGRLTQTAEFNVLFAKCGFNADWAIRVSDPTPSTILPAHLERGLAMTAFNVNLDWQGPGGYGTILSPPRLDLLQLSPDALKNYVISPNTLVRGSPVATYRSDWQAGHVVVPFNQLPWSQQNFGGLVSGELNKTVNTSKSQLLRVPLVMDVTYEFDNFGMKHQRTQRQCWDVSVMVEVQVEPDVIPEALLNASINITQMFIDTIDAIREPVQTVTLYTAVGCGFSYVAYLGKLIGEEYTCLVAGFDEDSFSPGDTIPQECRDAHASTLEFEETRNALCDRIFCPAPPVFNYYVEEVQNDPLSQCFGVDATDLSGLANLPDEDKCVDEYDSLWGWSCIAVDEVQDSRCFMDRSKCEDTSELFYAMAGICEDSDKVEQGTYCMELTGKDKRNYTVAVVEGNQWYYATRDIKLTTITSPNSVTREEVVRECKPDLSRPITSDEEKEKVGITKRRANRYVIDPTGGFITSAACVCLPAFNGYLTLWRNVLVEAQQCFQDIRLGNSNSGLCREFISVRLCDLAFDAIRCFVNAYGGGVGAEGGVGDRGISTFLRAVANAGKDIQQNTINRYGKTQLYRSFFAERKLVHAACAWAFTGDFDFDLEGLLNGGAAIPLNTTTAIIHPTRRFVNSNPINRGFVTWNYNIPTAIFAGSKATYSLELVCSDGTFCSETEGFIGGKCDCFGKGEKTYPITRNLGTGVLNPFDVIGITSGGNVYVQVVEHPVRYDKARLRVRYRDNEGREQENKLEEYILLDGPEPPLECQFSVLAAYFHCDFDVGDRGYAAFLQKPSPAQNIYGIGDPIRLNVNIEKWSPDNTDKSPAYTDPIPFTLLYSVRNQAGNLISEPGQPREKAFRIISDGVRQFTDLPGIAVSKEMLVGQRREETRVHTINNDVLNVIPLEIISIDSASAGAVPLRFAPYVAKSGDNQWCYQIWGGNYDTVTDTFNITGSSAINVDGAIPCPTGGLVRYYLLERDVISYQGVSIVVNKARMTGNGEWYAAGITYDPTPSTKTAEELCRDLQGASYLKWYVDMKLVYCEPTEDMKNRDSPPTTNAELYNGCVPSRQVVNFGGQAQDYSGGNAIEVKIQCSQPVPVPACEPDKRLEGPCLCTGASDCGLSASSMNYCAGAGASLLQQLCITYEVCKRDGTPVWSQNVISRCDCDGNGHMECADGDRCEAQLGGTFACIS